MDMDGMYMRHKETPSGWILWAAAAGRWLKRILGTNPSIRDPQAAAADPELQRLRAARDRGPAGWSSAKAN